MPYKSDRPGPSRLPQISLSRRGQEKARRWERAFSVAEAGFAVSEPAGYCSISRRELKSTARNECRVGDSSSAIFATCSSWSREASLRTWYVTRID